MKEEYYQMEYEAWDEGTDSLSLELEGAYLRLCHQMYRRRGPVPNQINTLARIWRCHQNKARRLLSTLLEEGKITVTPDGHLTNTKVTQVLDKRGIKSRQAVDAGHIGGIRSGEIRRNQLENNDQNEASASSTIQPCEAVHHIEEKRREEKNAAKAAPEVLPEAELFRRGKELLGQNSGGLIKNLLAAKNKNVALARAALETASTKGDAREYLMSIVHGRDSPNDLRARGDAW